MTTYIKAVTKAYHKMDKKLKLKFILTKYMSVNGVTNQKRPPL